MITRIKKLQKRRARIQKKLKVTGLRLTVSRSNKYLFAQIIDMTTGKTVLGLSNKSQDKNAQYFGSQFAKQAVAQGIKQIVFDRGGCLYHGKIKAFAQGAREGGLVF